jgi:hypothetical protein
LSVALTVNLSATFRPSLSAGTKVSLAKKNPDENDQVKPTITMKPCPVKYLMPLGKIPHEDKLYAAGTALKPKGA